jgi:hypothetical protein
MQHASQSDTRSGRACRISRRADILQRKSITTLRFAQISMSIAAPSGMKIALEKLGGWF